MDFSELVSDSETLKNLISLINNNTIPHAIMLSGNEGIGKLATSMVFVKYLYCDNKKDNISCNQCNSCKKIDKMIHPDIHYSFPVQLSTKVKSSFDLINEYRACIIDNPYISANSWLRLNGESKNGIISKDEALNILNFFSNKSYEGKYKVCIIWNADLMNISAANKLLKLIEEPPSKSIFILTTSNITGILPTIISRTQIFRFNKNITDDIANYLKNKLGFESQKAFEIATISNGSISKAIEYAEDSSIITEFYTYFTEWMRYCFQNNVVKAIEFVDVISKFPKNNQKQLLFYTLDFLENAFRINYIDIVNLNIDQNRRLFLEKFYPYINNNNIEKLHNYTSETINYIDRNGYSPVLLLDLTFKFFSLIKQKL